MARTRSLLLTLGVVVAAGCAPPAPLDAGGDDPIAALEAETGRRWHVRWADGLGTPAWLVGRTAPLLGNVATAAGRARAFLRQHRALLGGLDPDADLAPAEVSSDELGMIHVRFAERVAGLPVWHAEVRLHAARDGAIEVIAGRLVPILSAPSVPVYPAASARGAAASLLAALPPVVDASAVRTNAPELVLLPSGAGAARLMWRVEARRDDQPVPQAIEAFVDASSGEVVRSGSLVEALDGSGVGWFGDEKPLGITARDGKLWLEDGARGGSKTYTMADRRVLPGGGISSTDASRWDTGGPAPGAAVDVHAHVARVWDWFLRQHGRAGFDGTGAPVRAAAHVSVGWAGALFDGSHLVFGDGDGKTFEPLGAALDLVAHEYAHGVLRAAADLERDGETGAVSEGLADAFACLASAGSGRGADWQLGETVYHPAGLGAALRDLEAPWRTGQPTRVAEVVASAEDRGGVHRNGSIVGHAVWSVSAGPAGVGAARAARVLYRAATRYLAPTARWADAADAMVQAAHDLGDGDAEAAVRAAWQVAGVAPTAPAEGDE